MGKIHKAGVVSAALACAVLFSGCALFKFEDPDEIRDIESQISSEQQDIKSSLKSLLDEDRLKMEDTLVSESGVTLAEYSASFPYFNAGDSQVLKNINSYYETEFEQMEDDKQRFFQIVQANPSSVVRTSCFTYNIPDTPGDYISVIRKFESNDILGEVSSLYYCEVFSAKTGWTLRFDDVFDEGAKDALTKAAESWCEERGYQTGWLYNSGDGLLTDNFAFSGDTYYASLPSGVSPGGETLLELSMSGMEQYIK